MRDKMTEEDINSESNGAQRGRVTDPTRQANRARSRLNPRLPIRRTEYEVVHHPHLFGIRAQGEGIHRIGGARLSRVGDTRIGRVLIPTESVTEVRGGKKYTSERMFYPGYVLVEQWTWTTTCVACGEGNAARDRVCRHWPAAYSAVGRRSSADRLSRGRQQGKSRSFKSSSRRTESVRISEVPSPALPGVVDEVNEDRETLKVMVTIFGRSTPVELGVQSGRKS